MSAYDNLVREHAALQAHNCQLRAENGTAAREIAVLHAQLTLLSAENAELIRERDSLRRDVATVRRQRDEENSLRIDHHDYAERKIAELRARIATLGGSTGLRDIGAALDEAGTERSKHDE